MSTPFSVIGSFIRPDDPSLAADAIPISFSSVFDSEEKSVFALTGSGTKSVPLGSIISPGVKGLLIKVDPNSTGQNITVKVNGSSTGGIEISPGGFMLYGNSAPATGITQLDVVYTAACTVRIWVLG